MPRPALQAVLICALLVAPALTATSGCDQIMGVINSGQDEAKSNEANLRAFKERQAERLRQRRDPLAKLAKKPEEPAMKLTPGSPAFRLREQIEIRLECKEDPCRAKVLDAIRQQAAVFLPGLPVLLSGQTRQVTIEAIRLAGLFRHRPSVPGVGRAVTSGDRTMRMEAMWALGAIGDDRGVDDLRRLMEFDNPPWLEAEVCKALGQIGTAKAMLAIAKVYSVGEVNTRTECVQAAARIKSDDVAAFLVKAKGDPAPRVAAEARKALDALPDNESKRRALRL